MEEVDLKKNVQKISQQSNCFKLVCPFAMAICGPSQVGKSEFILQLIKNRQDLFSADFSRVIYCQPESLLSNTQNSFFQKIVDEIPMAEVNYGLPKLSDLHLEANSLPCLLIIDDLMSKFMNSVEMSQLLSIYVHHSNITCLFTLQNYFHPSRFGKTMIRNVHYRVLFYNRIEQAELRHISMQITPQCPNFLSSCFKFLQKYNPTRYSHYILIDGHSQSKMSEMHIRSSIFPEESSGEIKPIIFFPNIKNCKE
jgi:hypothetical protein